MGSWEEPDGTERRGCLLPLTAGGVVSALLVVASAVVELVTWDERAYLAPALQLAVLIGVAALVFAAFSWAARPDPLPPTSSR